MDTRSKILTSADAIPRPFVLVSGYFDVLRAEHVRELRSVRERTASRPLVVAVLRCPGEVVPHTARVQLVASLRMVDYVLTTDYEELSRIIERLSPAELVRFDEADRDRTRRLIEHVQRGQTR